MDENTSPLSTEKSWIKINPPVFLSSAVLTIIFVLLTILNPERAAEIFGSVQGWIAESVGWFYILSVATFLVFVIFLGVSSLGTIKLRPDHSEPDYTYISWFAMLFSAGMGIGLMSAFYPLIGERIYGPIGHAVDAFAVLGTMFGVATSLGLGVTQINAGQAPKYYRAEVHLREGGQDYDLMNWTREQVITDILDQYENHLHFLDIYR